MPCYEYWCEGCRDYYEGVCSVGERDTLACTGCGRVGARVVSAPVLVGVKPSYGYRVKQDRTLIQTNADRRRYDAANEAKGIESLSRSDSGFRDMCDEAAEEADKEASELGYQNHQDRSVKRRAERIRQRLASR